MEKEIVYSLTQLIWCPGNRSLYFLLCKCFLFIMPPSPLKNVRRWRYSVFGSVCPWVCLCVPKTLGTLYFKNQRREFHPILVIDVLWFIDVLISFSGQQLKGQGHGRLRHNRRWQPVEFHLVCISITCAPAMMTKQVLLSSGSVCLCACLSVTLLVCASLCAQKPNNYWSEIDETWRKYVLWWPLQVITFQQCDLPFWFIF